MTIALGNARREEHLPMTVIICIAGAVVGLIVAAISNWLVLPMVLQSQERHFARDYRSGSSKAWIKVKNPEAPAATRVLDGGF
jgi:hypothetical protein